MSVGESGQGIRPEVRKSNISAGDEKRKKYCERGRKHVHGGLKHFAQRAQGK